MFSFLQLAKSHTVFMRRKSSIQVYATFTTTKAFGYLVGMQVWSSECNMSYI